MSKAKDKTEDREPLTDKLGLTGKDKPKDKPADRKVTEDPARARKEDEGSPDEQVMIKGKTCPDHGTELADTNEGVGICGVPDCRYGAQALAESRHPEFLQKQESAR